MKEGENMIGRGLVNWGVLGLTKKLNSHSGSTSGSRTNYKKQ